MRIISGKYKGKNILGFNIVGTRPTQDRIKENLFNIINFKLKDKIILDLFAGSGNLSFESLSRGARFSYLCDNSSEAIKIINNNIKILGLDNIEVIKKDYKKTLLYLKDNKIKVDIIFLDPPYDSDYIYESFKLIDEYNILSDGGLVICESNNIDKIRYSNNYKCIVNKKYGDKVVVIVEKIC